MPYRVFLSYSHKDSKTARTLTEGLGENKGVRIFFADDALEPSRSITKTIIKSLKEADLVIVLWSSHSKISSWVNQEIGIAVAYQKPIIPLLLTTRVQLPGFLRDIKAVSVTLNKRQVFSALKDYIDDKANKKSRRRDSGRKPSRARLSQRHFADVIAGAAAGSVAGAVLSD